MPSIHDHGELLKSAVIDTIVPRVSNLDIEEALSQSPEKASQESETFPSIPQRQLLYFDESITVHVFLKLANCSEELLKEILTRLTIKVDVYAVSSQLLTQDGKTSEVMGQTSELVFSDLVKDREDPLVVVHDSFGEDDENVKEVFAFWKLDTFLNRPRTRLQNFSLVFSASATLTPPQLETRLPIEDEYMTSLTPLPVNLLESLKGDPALAGVDPYLPGSRLSRIIPATQTEKPSFQIRSKSQRRIRVVPAVSARIRYSRLNTFSSRLITVASLDFEVTPLVYYSVALERAELSLAEGKVEPLATGDSLELPVTCRPRDDITFLYKLTPEYGPDVNPPTTAIFDILEISIEARILVSDLCRPRIQMKWKANVDFSMPVNPTFGGPSQGLQRINRPASIPVAPTVANANGVITPVPNRPAARNRAHSIVDLGVTITFSGPEKVEVGKHFHWDVFIVNHSTKARKLSLIAIPKRRRGDVRKHASKTSSSSVTAQRNDVIAEAVADESIVYAMQKNGAVQGTDLICVSTEVRIGSLQPGSCHAMELKFLPLTAGALHLEAVRVIDAVTSEATDIRDLPDIIASIKDEEV